MDQVSVFSSDTKKTLHTLLPHLDKSYENKLLRVLKDPQGLKQFQATVNLLKKNLGSASSQKDTLIAQVLLDEISLRAAQQRLRIYNNALLLKQLHKMLGFPLSTLRQLETVYVSFSSRLHLDAELSKALQTIKSPYSSQPQQLRQAIQLLLEKATTRLAASAEIVQKNKRYIFQVADTYHVPVILTNALLKLYTQPASVAFHPEFERIFNILLTKNSFTSLCASLSVRTLLYELTLADAQEIACLQHLLNRNILEKDLLTISCRYLRKKSPQDIFNTFETVLKKLPHLTDPDENIELAVNVLLAGTPESLQTACQTATVTRAEKLLFNQLLQDPSFNGYEQALSKQFALKQDAQQLKESLQNILSSFSDHASPDADRALACQILLGTVTPQEAKIRRASSEEKSPISSKQTLPK